jgi:hypothetical protein
MQLGACLSRRHARHLKVLSPPRPTLRLSTSQWSAVNGFASPQCGHTQALTTSLEQLRFFTTTPPQKICVVYTDMCSIHTDSIRTVLTDIRTIHTETCVVYTRPVLLRSWFNRPTARLDLRAPPFGSLAPATTMAKGLALHRAKLHKKRWGKLANSRGLTQFWHGSLAPPIRVCQKDRKKFRSLA